MTKQRRDDRGAAMVEFAIILPLLIMLLLGIIQFGLAYHTQISIQAAAREGARELALGHDTDVVQRVRDAAPSVDIDTITPTIGPGGTSCDDPTAETASVTVTETFEFNIPLFPGTLGTTTLEATGVMRCGL